MSDAVDPNDRDESRHLPVEPEISASSSTFQFAESANGDQCQTDKDRRRRRRALISTPLRVRRVHLTDAGPDEVSTTVDVSRSGLLFVATHPGYVRDMDVMVTFPYSTVPTAIHAEQHGRVARVHELPDGRHAVAIALSPTGNGVDLVDAGGRKLNQAPVTRGKTDHEESKKPLVLAMDANPAIRESLKEYLTAEGYEVIAVNNSSDARDVLNLFTPVLVIAEIEGEGLPGYAICAHVKGTPRLQRIPVVLTTASAYPSDYSSAHSLGAVVCMAKPYKQERLGHIVRLLAPLPHVKMQTNPPRPADPTRKPGINQRKAGFRSTSSSAPNSSIIWRFRSAK